MPHVAVDTDLADTPEGAEFCELLGEDERACWYLVRLWGWGALADREDGTVPAAMARVPARVAHACHYFGDPQRIWLALTSELGPERLRWLEPRPDGSYYMRGWSRMERFFREKRRLRELAEQRRIARETARSGGETDGSDAGSAAGSDDGTRATTQKSTRAARSVARVTPRGNTSPSPSPYIDLNKSREEKPVALRPDTPAPRVWRPGTPIATVADLEQAVASFGWSSIGIAEDLRGIARVVLAVKPIEPHEYDDAKSKAQVKRDTAEGRIRYLLNTVSGKRVDAAKAAPPAGSEWERGRQAEASEKKRHAAPYHKKFEQPDAEAGDSAEMPAQLSDPLALVRSVVKQLEGGDND